MSFWDSISGAVSSIGDWYGKNEKLIGGLANAGKNIYQSFNQAGARQDTRSGIADILEKQALAELDYQNRFNDWQAKNSAANAAASAAASRAAAATRNANAAATRQAQMANDAAELAAAKKALGVQKKGYGQIGATYQPMIDQLQTLLPKQSANYGQFLDTSSLLSQYLSNKVMNPEPDPVRKPVWESGIPRSAYAADIPASSVTLPDINEILRRR